MKSTVGIIIVALILIGGYFIFNNQNNSDVSTAGMVQDSEQILKITTSFYPLQYALARIVGEYGTVTNIGEGRDPHDFKPSTQDMVLLQQADLVVLHGADFEPWGDGVRTQLEADNVPVISATQRIELHEGGHGHEEEHVESEDHADEAKDEHGSYDPHTWLDPILFSEMVDYIAEEVIALDPENTEVYQKNVVTLQSELAELHTEYESKLAKCALSEVITSHDAFGYVGDRYSFSVHSITGLSTQDMPSITTLAMLKEEAEEGIGAILLEENSVTAYGETLARETGLQTLSLNPIAYIIPEGEDYLTLMQKNLDTFAIALQCNE